MIVAGYGFRPGATLAALQDALARAGGTDGVTHLATLAVKAAGLEPLAQAMATMSINKKPNCVAACKVPALMYNVTVTTSP